MYVTDIFLIIMDEDNHFFLSLHNYYCQFFYSCKEFLIILVLTYIIHDMFFNLSNKQAVRL